MRLASFIHDGRQRLGVVDPTTDTLTDLARAAPDLPTDMSALIALGGDGLATVRAAVAAAGDDARLTLGSVALCAPLAPPRRDPFAVGRNYHEHAREFHDSGFDATAGATAVPDHPIVFTKATTSVSGPYDPIPAHLDPTRTTDYEGELAVIIGPGGRDIGRERAFDHVYGYTVSNDVTARTLQHQHKQWTLGKGLDGYCPMGPVLLTADEVADVREMRLRTWVNGALRQDAHLGDLIFDIPTLIETIAAGITLLPGDVILTGTPVGVGIGFDPPVFLQAGDVVRVTIDPIGSIENPVE